MKMRPYITALAVSCSMLAIAQTPPQTVQVLYINGIMNTRVMATDSKVAIYDNLCSSPNHLGSATLANGCKGKKAFTVTLDFNPTGWDETESSTVDNPKYSPTTTWSDVQELYLQKIAEERYSKHFDSIIVPWNKSNVPNTDAAGRVVDTALLDNMLPKNNQLVTFGQAVVGPIPTPLSAKAMTGVAKVLNTAIAAINSNPSMILIAHSQGNLIANIAYARTVQDLGADAKKRIAVVNVANTAQFSPNGLDLTLANDGALYKDGGKFLSWSLEDLPSAGNNWPYQKNACESTEIVFAHPILHWCKDDFTMSKAQFVNFKKVTGLGHEFVENYLSSSPVNHVSPDTSGIAWTGTGAMNERFEDMVYAGASSLDKASAPPSPPDPTPLPPPDPTWHTIADTNFALPVPNVSLSGDASYNASAGALVLTGGNAYTQVHIGPRAQIVRVYLQIGIGVTAAAPSQNGLAFWSDSAPHTLSFDMPYGLNLCGQSNPFINAMTGRSGGWDCSANTGIDMKQLVGTGYFEVNMTYNVKSCNVTMSVNFSNGYSRSFNWNVSSVNCAAPTSFVITAGMPNYNGLMFVRRVKVDALQ